MTSSKLLTVVLAAAVSFSGVNAGKCKPSPPVSTPVLTPESTPVSTPVSTPISTPRSTPISISDSTPIPTPDSTPIVTVELPPVATPDSTPTPTPTPVTPPANEETCSVSSNPDVSSGGNCGRIGDLDTSANGALSIETGVTLNKCATLANNAGVEGQTGAGSFVYALEGQECYLFAPLSEGVTSFTANDNNYGNWIQYDWYCFDCPNSGDGEAPIREPEPEPEPEPQCTLRDPVQNGVKCGVVGSVNEGARYLISSCRNSSRDECALKCSEEDDCVTFGIADDGTCKLYKASPNTLCFKSNPKSLTLYELACFDCGDVPFVAV